MFLAMSSVVGFCEEHKASNCSAALKANRAVQAIRAVNGTCSVSSR